MQHPEHTLSILTREDLEDAWRVRSEMARERHETARRRYKKLLDEKPEGLIPRDDRALALARDAASEARAEYLRTLKGFTDLVVRGLVPEEQLSANANGGPGLTARSLISVVDDDQSIRDSTRTLLRSAGYEVATFESAELFLKSHTLPETRCLVLDIRLPGMSGLELQRQVSLAHSSVPVIFVTAHDDKAYRKLATDAGASEVFQKPFSANAFLTAVNMALNNSAVGPLVV